MSEPIRMTDKAETKEVPCAVPGCEARLLVTKFFAPSKARCPDHQGRPREFHVSGNGGVNAPPPETAVANEALRWLACPFHPIVPMRVIRVIQLSSDRWQMTFECSDCMAVVEVTPRWSPLLIPVCPEPLRPVIDAFNAHAGRKPVRWRG